jgi:hypothetical protein
LRRGGMSSLLVNDGDNDVDVDDDELINALISIDFAKRIDSSWPKQPKPPQRCDVQAKVNG